MHQKKLDRAIWMVAVVGSLVLLNVVGLGLFTRFDLTRDRQFTLSDATLATLRDLHEPLTIRAYFTKDLPPPHSTNARFVKDLLDEYYNHAHGMVRFEFIDPMAEESSEDKERKKDVKQDMFGRQVREATAMERELAQMGIPPVQVRVNEEDKLEVKRAYMGLAVLLDERKEVIPVVSDTTGLEYDLTTSIRKLGRAHTPKVGVLTGHEVPESELTKARSILTQLFDVVPTDLQKGGALADLDALLVIGPKTPFSEQEKRSLDAYLTSGHSVGIFAGPFKPNLQSLQGEDNNADLHDMLASYGISMEPGLVLDAECATISVTQQTGFMRVNQPVRYPLMALPRSLEHHALTRGLGQVVFPFMAPLTLNPPEGVKAVALVESSKDSWVMPPPFNLDPMQHWTAPAEGMQAHTLVASVEGPLKSFYGQAGDPNQSFTGARLLVMGSQSVVTDAFLSKTNETLLLNFVDWLVRDDDLLAVRSRGMAALPLRALSDTTRNSVKYFNMLGLPAMFVGFGLVRWRRRESRRDKIAL